MGSLPRITKLESWSWVINPRLSDLQAPAPSRSFLVGASWHFLEQDVSLCTDGLYTTQAQHPQSFPLSDSGHQSLGLSTQIPWGVIHKLCSAQHSPAGRIFSAAMVWDGGEYQALFIC